MFSIDSIKSFYDHLFCLYEGDCLDDMIQRAFSDLEISEKVAVLKKRYDKVLYQRQMERIMEEVDKLEGKHLRSGHGDHHFNDCDEVGKEYDLSGSSVGGLLR